VLRALGKLDAATYHCSNLASRVQSSHKNAKTLAGKLGDPANAKVQPDMTRVSGVFSVREIAFEIDAFLAAARASIDFGGTLLALHLGMNGRTSITRVLQSVEKSPMGGFAFLLGWAPWIEALKRYRDECVHYRTLRPRTGYEAARRKGALAVAVMPFVIPQEIASDQPDTRATRFGMGRDDDYPLVGLDKIESWGTVRFDNGNSEVVDHSIEYIPSKGYVRVEDFCAQHLEKLREFLIELFEAALKAKFAFQK